VIEDPDREKEGMKEGTDRQIVELLRNLPKKFFSRQQFAIVRKQELVNRSWLRSHREEVA